MESFLYRDGRLCAEDVAIPDLAREVGTPAYVYSKGALTSRYDAIAGAFALPPAAGPLDASAPKAGLPFPIPDPLICFSVKSNGNLSILKLMKERGSGFDVVSGGELFRTMKVGADPRSVVFAGVGKTDEEIRSALEKEILLFNVESRPELERIHQVAKEMGRRARVTIRVNPDVDPRTHRYIATGKKETKFGIDFERASDTIEHATRLDGVELLGLHMHIGSQILETEPYRQATEKVVAFADAERAKGRPIRVLNMGGGFGIDYQGRAARSAAEIAAVVAPPVRARGYGLLLEPGRSITGNAGILVTRVVYVKESGEKRFVICDSGMNHLIRPSLYGSYHRIWPVAAAAAEGDPGAPAVIGEADIVGPICESGDFFAKDRPFPAVKAGDLVAIFSAGAYGMSMASNYNAHPRPPEVLVDGAAHALVRRRETYEDLVQGEVS